MEEKLSLSRYIIGFIYSLIVTLGAYILTQLHVNSAHEFISHEILIPAIIILAMIQLVIQMTYFLHIWEEKKPFWNLLFFVGTIGFILLIVIASLWIMNHLNYNMMPSDMTKFIIKDEGIHH